MANSIKTTLILVFVLVLLAALIWFFCIRSSEFPAALCDSIGSLCIENGNPGLASSFFRTAFQLDPREDYALHCYRAYYGIQNYTKSEYYLASAVQINPENVNTYILLSKLFVEQDKLMDAERLITDCTNDAVRQSLEAIRPGAPRIAPEGGYYYSDVACSISYDTGYAVFSLNDEFPSAESQKYASDLMLHEGTTTVTAIVIGENGLVSRHCEESYTVCGDIHEVHFENAQIEEQVRASLGKSKHEPVLSSELWDIDSLVIPANCTDLSFLTDYIGLTKLTVSGSAFDLTPLTSLRALSVLSFEDTVFSNEALETLSSLQTLTSLSVRSCSLTDVGFLSQLLSLRVLDLSMNQLNDILPLSSLDALQILNLSGNQITDLSPVATMTELTELNIEGNPVGNLGALSSNTALTKLSAASCDIAGIQPLENKVNLTYLDLSNNDVYSVEPLSNCKMLNYLNLSHNKIHTIKAIKDCEFLTELDASSNRITECPKFCNSCKLIKLNLSENLIPDVKGLSALYNLAYLEISDNLIPELDTVASLPAIVKVTAYNNPIDSVSSLEERSILVFYTPGYKLPTNEEESDTDEG